MSSPVFETNATSEVPTGRTQVACSECSLGNLCLPRKLDENELAQFERIVQKLRPAAAGRACVSGR